MLVHFIQAKPCHLPQCPSGRAGLEAQHDSEAQKASQNQSSEQKKEEKYNKLPRSIKPRSSLCVFSGPKWCPLCEFLAQVACMPLSSSVKGRSSASLRRSLIAFHKMQKAFLTHGTFLHSTDGCHTTTSLLPLPDVPLAEREELGIVSKSAFGLKLPEGKVLLSF